MRKIVVVVLVASVTIVVSASSVLGQSWNTLRDQRQAMERWDNATRMQTRQAFQELNGAFRELDQRMPDPVDTWNREYAVDVTKEVARTWFDVTEMTMFPSVSGAVGIAATAMKPIEPRAFGAIANIATVTGITKSTMRGDFVGAGFSATGWVAKNGPLASTFDRNATISHRATMNIDHSWNDGWNAGYARGQIVEVKTFRPDYRAIRAGEYPGGTFTRERYITQPYTVVQTTGVKDPAEFMRRWNFSPTPTNWNTYRPTYTPSVQYYQPPRVQVYTPPTYTSPPAYRR